MTEPTHVPRYRDTAFPAVFAHGFRPFFLLAGIWAPIALAVSIEMIQGRIALPTVFDPVTWHYHEMLFGYVAAAIAGFLLTAIPNWTGRLPLQGGPLLGLVLLWLAGRVAVAISAIIGPWPAALIDLAFLFVLAAIALRELLAGKNWRSLPIVFAVGLFLTGNALSHLVAIGLIGSYDLPLRFSAAVVIALIALIGGRIIPSFTRNWLAKRDAARLPSEFGTFDMLTLAATIVALVAWISAPNASATAALIAIAAMLHLVRLARWRGQATFPEPLLLVLHVAYLWIPIGLALLALSIWFPAIPTVAAIHALTAGTMGTMTLAVMSRATLGHTGRPLTAGTGLTAVFVLITVAAVVRVAASLWSAQYTPMLTVAAVAWIAAFVVYLATCGPMLVTRRPATTPTPG